MLITNQRHAHPHARQRASASSAATPRACGSSPSSRRRSRWWAWPGWPRPARRPRPPGCEEPGGEAGRAGGDRAGRRRGGRGAGVMRRRAPCAAPPARRWLGAWPALALRGPGLQLARGARSRRPPRCASAAQPRGALERLPEAAGRRSARGRCRRRRRRSGSRRCEAAGDVSYLELGDYAGAIAYYRRHHLALARQPGGAARPARSSATSSATASRTGWPPSPSTPTSPPATRRRRPRFQLKVAREYLELGNAEQARAEARVAARALAHQRRGRRGPAAHRPGLGAREAERGGAARLPGAGRPPPGARDWWPAPWRGRPTSTPSTASSTAPWSSTPWRCPHHPNPQAIRTNIEAVRRRRKAAAQTGHARRPQRGLRLRPVPSPPTREITP